MYYAHLHLPRYKNYLKGGRPEVISVKPVGGRVFYVATAEFTNAYFVVSQKGRARCLETGQRNVHAWVVGDYHGDVDYPPEDAFKAVYDPWKGNQFVDADTLIPILTSCKIWMVGKDVYYKPTGLGV